MVLAVLVDQVVSAGQAVLVVHRVQYQVPADLEDQVVQQVIKDHRVV